MATCFDVAKYFLHLADPEKEHILSNLKIQKLVYYAQGFSLVLLGRPLFSEKMKAWDHGPVVPELYHEYKTYGSDTIPWCKDISGIGLSPDERRLLDEVYEVFGQFSAWALRNMTHAESPWKDTTPGAVISHADMKRYFLTQVQ